MPRNVLAERKAARREAQRRRNARRRGNSPVRRPAYMFGAKVCPPGYLHDSAGNCVRGSVLKRQKQRFEDEVQQFQADRSASRRKRVSSIVRRMKRMGPVLSDIRKRRRASGSPRRQAAGSPRRQAAGSVHKQVRRSPRKQKAAGSPKRVARRLKLDEDPDLVKLRALAKEGRKRDKAIKILNANHVKMIAAAAKAERDAAKAVKDAQKQAAAELRLQKKKLLEEKKRAARSGRLAKLARKGAKKPASVSSASWNRIFRKAVLVPLGYGKKKNVDAAIKRVSRSK